MLLAYCVIRLSSFRNAVPRDNRLGPRCGGVLLHIEGGHLQAECFVVLRFGSILL